MARARRPSEWYMEIRIPLQVRETPEPGPRRVRTPEEAASLLPHYGDLDREMFTAILLNSRNNVINAIPVSSGLLDASLVHPREVFREAIRQSAAMIVMLHNHPSGDCTPSAEDIRITRQLVAAGQIIGIKVQDHVVIGQRQETNPRWFMSMREEGLVNFT